MVFNDLKRGRAREEDGRRTYGGCDQLGFWWSFAICSLGWEPAKRARGHTRRKERKDMCRGRCKGERKTHGFLYILLS